MTVQDFITKNGLSSYKKGDDGTFMFFEPSNFMVHGFKVERIKIKYNRDLCLMHVYLIGTNLMKLGEEMSKDDYGICELGFKCLVQSYSDSEITIYSIDPDSHVYDLPYHTGESWEDLMGW